MVEFSPATREARVRFPASASLLLRFLLINVIGCFSVKKYALITPQGKTKDLSPSVSFVSLKVKIKDNEDF